MTDPQENKLSMNHAVKKVNVKFQTVVDTVPALNKAQGDFVLKIDEIETMKSVQALVTSGVTEDKAFKMVSMVNDAVVLVGAGSAYARVKKDFALLENINYSQSDLLYARDQDAYTLCQKIYDSLNPFIGDLAEYGVTPLMMTDYQTKVTAYKDAVQNPRGAIVDRVSATQQLVVLFKESDDILLIMDGLVKQFKTTQVDYYNEYFASREIIDLGVRHTKPPVPPTP